MSMKKPENMTVEELRHYILRWKTESKWMEGKIKEFEAELAKR